MQHAGIRSPLQRVLRCSPSTSLPVLNLCVAAFLVAVFNVPFWRAVLHAAGEATSFNVLFLASFAVLVLVLVNLLLTAITWGRLAKPVLGLVLILSATVSYFIHAYGVAFDRSTMASIVETHREEVIELISPELALWVAVLGVLPAALVARVRLASPSWWRRGVAAISVVAITAGALTAVALLSYEQYAAFLRNHGDLRFLLVPSNYMEAAYGYARQRFGSPSKIEIVGADARPGPSRLHERQPTLMLLVIGETARASQFGLNGYARPTNPELSREDVISFRQTRSCGTVTAVSLPCMFMDVGHDRYRDSMARSREGLLDVLQRAGFQVLWLDNDSGCKHACDRVPHEDISHANIADLCPDECYDEILLHGLQERIDRMHGDRVVVLHMKGSHGPAYYLRYPAQFETFRPTCKTGELADCKPEALMNAYDNTIRYTDHVLAQAIHLLQSNSARFDTALLYVSDHGESLGEHGLYLHGLPYAIAPAEQTHVPMLLWLSSGMRQDSAVDERCLRANANKPYSHDYLFHSVLGLLDVQTAVYIPEKDLFRGCRAASVTGAPVSESPAPA